MEVREASAAYTLQPSQNNNNLEAIPNGWRLVPLSHLSAFITKGATPTTYGFKWENSGILFLRSECVSESGLDLAQSMYISQKAHATLNRSAIVNGDILITITGNVGRAVRYLNVEEANLNQHIARVRIISNHADPSFIYHSLSQPSVRQRFNSITTGQAYPQLSLKQVRDVQVPLPPVQEQKAISDALSDADALIEALEQLLAKKRQIKQGAMQELLTGQRRLPGFVGEWKSSCVAELGELVTGGTPRTDVKEYWGDDYPWITPTDISSGRDMLASERSLTQAGLNVLRSLPANTVLITCIASIGKNAVLKTKGACNQQINALIPNATNSAEFLYYLFEANKHYLLANAGTTATSIISKTTFGAMLFVLPELSEQTAIATVLADMDADIAALEAKLAKARDLKQGMMQQLLTGRIRLV